MVGSLPVCCARAASGHARRRAAEQRYELPSSHAGHGRFLPECRRRSYQLGTAGRRLFEASGMPRHGSAGPWGRPKSF